MKAIDGIESAKYVSLDIFPAEVSHTADETTKYGNEFRLIVTDTHMYALEETGSGVKVRVKVDVRDNEFAGTNKDGYTVKETDGGVWNFSRAGHCGCGSRLRGVHPFPGVPHISQLSK